MAAYVKRAVALFGARVSLIHVADPGGYNGLQLYVRPVTEVLEEHLSLCRGETRFLPGGRVPRGGVSENSDFGGRRDRDRSSRET